MRNISFQLTTRQVRERSKTVTRRLGWWNVQPGELLQAVVKGMGLKKGETAEKLAVIRVVSARGERLSRMKKEPEYGRAEAIKEGFPEMDGAGFVAFFTSKARCRSSKKANRIEFEYVE